MRRPLWIITSYYDDRMEALTIDLSVEGCSLAVFSFDAEAEAFLRLLLDGEEQRQRWQSQQTTARELVSLLHGACADVKRVALDPLPLPLGRGMLPLVSVNRDTFLQYLSEDRRGMAADHALG